MCRNLPESYGIFPSAFGMLAGALLTAVIQSSSASVGILQALCVTGAVTYGSAIPIIMGQNIGTCDGASVRDWGKQECKTRGHGTFVF